MKKFIGLAVLLVMLVAAVAIPVMQKRGGRDVEIGAVERRQIKSSVISSGVLNFEDQVQLSPEVIGTVLAVAVKEGDFVTQGDLLLRIDDRTLRSEVAEYAAVVRMQQANLSQSGVTANLRQQQFARDENLANRGFATRAVYEELGSGVSASRLEAKASGERLVQAQAALQRAQSQLAKTAVRSPASGTVVAVNIKSGETAVPSSIGIAGSSLMTIANINSLIAEVNVGEADIASVRPGQEVSITAAAYPDRPLKGVIRSLAISPKREGQSLSLGGGSQARTYTVKVELSRPEGMVLRPGMSCRAEIFTRQVNQSAAVPIQAVLSTADDKSEFDQKEARKRGGEHYVFAVNGSRVVRRVVKLGLSDDSYQEIVSGLKPGDRVVVGPYRELKFLRDGDPIRTKAKQS
jgi:HlyD family secretion protein